MLTPYQFASNKPIEGIDLDGLEFVNAEESFYDLKFGQTWVKPARFRDLFKRQADVIASQIRKDYHGYPYIGASIPIQEVRFNRQIPTISPVYDGDLAEGLQYMGSQRLGEIYENTPRKKDGSLDRRTFGSRTYESGAQKLAGIGKVGLTLVMIDLMTDLSRGIKGYFNTKKDIQQRDYVNKSWNFVIEAIELGKVDDEFINQQDLSSLADFIFQGTKIKDQRLQDIAIDISKNVAKNYRPQLKLYGKDGGLGEYNTTRKYLPSIDNYQHNRKEIDP